MRPGTFDRWRRMVGALLCAAMLVLLTGARYRVRAGDTYASVASAFGVDEVALRNVNPGVRELAVDNLIVVPTIPPQHVWSPARPYAPPTPTVTQLMQEIDAGTVTATPHPTRPGVYVMHAGTNLDVEIGELRTARVGGRSVHDVYLHPETGRGGAIAAVPLTTRVPIRLKRPKPPPPPRPVKLGRTESFSAPRGPTPPAGTPGDGGGCH